MSYLGVNAAATSASVSILGANGKWGKNHLGDESRARLCQDRLEGAGTHVRLATWPPADGGVPETRMLSRPFTFADLSTLNQ